MVWKAWWQVCKKAGHTVSTGRKESKAVPGDQYAFFSHEVWDTPSPLDRVLFTFRIAFPISVNLIQKIIAPMPEACLHREPRFYRIDTNPQRVHFICGAPVAWKAVS